MRVKEEYKSEGNTRAFDETVHQYLAEFPNCIYKRKSNEDPLTTLAPARGKIVIIRNYADTDPNNDAYGLPYNYAKVADFYDVSGTWSSKEHKKQDF
jgi:hypothetical protein